MNQKFNFTIALIALCSLLFLSQCSEDSILWSPDGPLLEATVIHGLVTGPNGAPLEGVVISTPYEKAITDELGLFHIAQGIAIKGRVSVQADKEGYFSTAYATQTGGESTIIKFVLSPQTVTDVSSATAGNVSIGAKAEVDLPANGFVDAAGNAYTGTVKVSTAHCSPDDPMFRRQMPAGADMTAVTADGGEAVLISYGAVAVELTDEAGNELQLAPGSTAEIRMEVPADQLADAPATIPLWYFDETTGKWLEEGFATLVGNEYVGEVSHFSWWNCDDPIDPRAFVTGRVLDCNGNPVSDITVNVGPVTVVTNFDGYYSTNVAVGLEFEVWVTQIFNFGLQSNVIYVPSIAIGENLMLEDLIIPCPATISGVLTDCEGNPTSGAVTATWDGGSNLVNTASDGSFKIIVLGNTEVEVTGVLFDVLTGTQTVTSIANQIVDLPTPLEVSCSSTIVGTFAACGGGSTNGTVYVNWDGSEVSVETLGGGFFILVPGGTEVELQFISDDYYTVSTTLISNPTGITNMATVLEACDIALEISGPASTCSGSSVTLDAGSFNQYLWNGGTTTQTLTDAPTAATQYCVTVTDINGYTGIDCHYVTMGLPFEIMGPTSTCSGSSITVDAGAFDQYSWDNGSTTQTIIDAPTTASQYCVTVTDANGCTGEDCHDVTINPDLTPTISGSASFCAGSNTVLDVGAFDQYQWDDASSSTTQTITVSPTADTQYCVTVTDVMGCTGSGCEIVTIDPNLTFTILGPSSACSDSTIVLDAGVFDQYVWNGGTTMQTLTVSQTTASQYCVTVVDAIGCTGEACHEVIIDPCL